MPLAKGLRPGGSPYQLFLGLGLRLKGLRLRANLRVATRPIIKVAIILSGYHNQGYHTAKIKASRRPTPRLENNATITSTTRATARVPRRITISL